MQNLTEAIFLLDLDCLLDTRFTCLLHTNKKEAIKLLHSGRYHDRVVDEFEDIDYDVYKELYNNRDKRILEQSTPTFVTNILYSYVASINESILNTPDTAPPVIHLNTYPYVLSKSEQNLFKRIIRSKTESTTKINIVHLSTDDITPRYLDDNIVIFMKYDWYNWLEHHSCNKNLEKHVCPTVMLQGVKSLDRIPKHKPELKLTDDGLNDMFEKIIENDTVHIINLALIPPRAFSTIIDLEK